MFFFVCKSVACHLLADYLETIKKDFDKARKVYQSNCYDYSHGKSCYKFGSYAFLGKGAKGTKGDTVEALKAYEKGCETGEPGACLHAGLLHTSKALKDEKLEQNFMKVNTVLKISLNSIVIPLLLNHFTGIGVFDQIM